MSNVTLSIGGRSFTVACAEGEEAHVAELGRTIDAKVSEMGDLTGHNESRILLFAALLLADELHERTGRDAEIANAPVLSSEAAERLNAMAAKLENLASRLEGCREAT